MVHTTQKDNRRDGSYPLFVLECLGNGDLSLVSSVFSPVYSHIKVRRDTDSSVSFQLCGRKRGLEVSCVLPVELRTAVHQLGL